MVAVPFMPVLIWVIKLFVCGNLSGFLARFFHIEPALKLQNVSIAQILDFESVETGFLV